MLIGSSAKISSRFADVYFVKIYTGESTRNFEQMNQEQRMNQESRTKNNVVNH